MRNRKKIFKTLICAGKILMLFLLCAFLTGCGRLKSERAIKSGIRSMFPDAAVVDVEETVDQDGYLCRTYQVENRDIAFKVENYQKRSSLFGIKTAVTSNDYAEKLFLKYESRIREAAESRGMEVRSSAWDYVIRVTNSIDQLSDAGTGVDVLREVYEITEKDLPEHLTEWFEFGIVLETDCGYSLDTMIADQRGTDFAYEKDLLYLNLADYIRRGVIDSVSYTETELDRIPVKNIDSLYIDGKQYLSDRYDTRFTYNLADGTYYTVVCFGTSLDYNGGVEDYLQREIIEDFYPDSGYTIDGYTSTYRIGTDRYEVSRKKKGLSFRKNNRKLDIQVYEKLNRETPDATYYYWISIDDFASLMGMKVEKMDETGLYLSTEDN